MEIRYEVCIDGEGPIEVSAAALVDVWGESAPFEAARVFDLEVGKSIVLRESPRIEARRIE